LTGDRTDPDRRHQAGTGQGRDHPAGRRSLGRPTSEHPDVLVRPGLHGQHLHPLRGDAGHAHAARRVRNIHTDRRPPAPPRSRPPVATTPTPSRWARSGTPSRSAGPTPPRAAAHRTQRTTAGSPSPSAPPPSPALR